MYLIHDFGVSVVIPGKLSAYPKRKANCFFFFFFAAVGLDLLKWLFLGVSTVDFQNLWYLLHEALPKFSKFSPK